MLTEDLHQLASHLQIVVSRDPVDQVAPGEVDQLPPLVGEHGPEVHGSETLFCCPERPAFGRRVVQARYSHQVEVYVPHELGSWGVGGFQAREQLVVAKAVRFAVYGVVGEVVSAGESSHFHRAEVMGPAASVHGPLHAQVVVVFGYVAGATPFGP